MSDTPKPDFYDCHGGPGTTQDACGACVTCIGRFLENKERELAAAKNQIGLLISGAKKDERTIKYLQERIQRLIDAGERLYERCDMEDRLESWNTAKEEKQ